MNMDIEGHELHALRSIDWNYTSIDVLIIETVKAPLYAMLTNLGYWNRATIEPDQSTGGGKGPRELWIHRRVPWGKKP